METERLTLTPIKGGWAAVARDWAVFGKTRDEAISLFNTAEAHHEEILKRARRKNMFEVRHKEDI